MKFPNTSIGIVPFTVFALSTTWLGCVAEPPESDPDAGVTNVAPTIKLSGPLPRDAGQVQISLDENDPFTVDSGKWTKVPFRAKIYDNLGAWNSQTKTFTAPRDDYYAVCASVGSFTQDFELDLFIDGNRERAFAVGKNGIAQGCRTIYLKYNQKLDVRVYQTSVASLSFAHNLYWSWMTIYGVSNDAYALDTAAFAAPSSQFAQVRYNSAGGSGFDPATSQFTSTRVGDYQVCASAASFVPDFEIDAYLNNNRTKALAVSSYGAATGCRLVRMAVGDTLDVRVWQSTVASMSFGPNTYWNWLDIDSVHGRVSATEIRPFTVPSDTGLGFTSVPYDYEEYDDLGEYDPTNSRFTAALDGHYEFCASLASFVGAFELDLFINGIRENAFAISKYGAATGCRILRMKKGDYVQVRAHQETGSPMTFNQNGAWNWLTVAKRD